jgi:hypothetical protein
VEDGDISIVDGGGITELDPAGDRLLVDISGFAEWLLRKKQSGAWQYSGPASSFRQQCRSTRRETMAAWPYLARISTKFRKLFFAPLCARLATATRFRSSSCLKLHGSFRWQKASRGAARRGGSRTDQKIR